MKEQFHNLSVEQLPDGTVRMTQQSGLDAPAVIDAHLTQIISVARSLVGARASPEAERIKTLERRIRWLQDRFLGCYEELPSDFAGSSPCALQFYAWLEASCDVAAEYCADLTQEAGGAK
jgi:hypothetical protein